LSFGFGSALGFALVFFFYILIVHDLAPSVRPNLNLQHDDTNQNLTASQSSAQSPAVADFNDSPLQQHQQAPLKTSSSSENTSNSSSTLPQAETQYAWEWSDWECWRRYDEKSQRILSASFESGVYLVTLSHDQFR
jgi:hypothetical protein